jgi:hypothetical protein
MSLHWFSNVTPLVLQCHSPNPLCCPCLSRLLKNSFSTHLYFFSSTVPLYNFSAAFLPSSQITVHYNYLILIGLPLPYFTIFSQSSFTLDAVLNVLLKKLSPACPRILSLGRRGATLPASCPTSWCSRKRGQQVARCNSSLPVAEMHSSCPSTNSSMCLLSTPPPRLCHSVHSKNVTFKTAHSRKYIFLSQKELLLHKIQGIILPFLCQMGKDLP